MRHIDITVDFETCSLSANAAVLQVAAVAWKRDADMCADVFDFSDCGTSGSFSRAVDLRSCLFDGFDFERRTCEWWAEQEDSVKQSILNATAHSLKDAVQELICWMANIKEAVSASSLCLWAQWSDFDIAVLRNICGKYGLRLPFDRHSFRDARTFIIEIGGRYLTRNVYEAIADNSRVYDMLPPLEIKGLGKHNALFDAYTTSNNLWHCFSAMPDKE